MNNIIPIRRFHVLLYFTLRFFAIFSSVFSSISSFIVCMVQTTTIRLITICSKIESHAFQIFRAVLFTFSNIANLETHHLLAILTLSIFTGIIITALGFIWIFAFPRAFGSFTNTLGEFFLVFTCLRAATPSNLGIFITIMMVTPSLF